MEIKLGDLASRAIRQKVTPGGIKRIATKQYKQIQRQDGGIGGFLLDVAGRFFGFLIKAVFGIASWSLSLLWQWICSSVSFLWNFDWNKSDEAMDSELNAAWNAFGSTLGGAIGSTLGWITAGAIGGAITFTLNEAMFVHVLNEMGSEGLEEISSHALGVIQSGSRIFMRTLFNWGYQKGREALTGENQKIYMTDEELKQKVASGQMTQALADKNKAGRDALKRSQERKPFSFALAWEKWVESIPNEFLRNVISSAWEEYWEAIQQGGFVCANSMDSYYAQQNMNSRAHYAAVNRTNTVMVQLNRQPSATNPDPSPTT